MDSWPRKREARSHDERERRREGLAEHGRRERRRREEARALLRAEDSLDVSPQALAHPLLDAVGADRRDADDLLGGATEEVRHARSHVLERRPHLGLKDDEGDHEGDEGSEHDKREDPRVRDHHAEDDDHLERRHEHRGARPLHEVAHDVDVARDARHVVATLLRVLGEHREAVHVSERLDPKGREAAFGRGHHPAANDPRDDGRDDQDCRPHRRVEDDEAHVDAAFREQAVVGDALRQEGDGSAAGGREGGQDECEAEPRAELGADGEAATERRGK